MSIVKTTSLTDLAAEIHEVAATVTVIRDDLATRYVQLGVLICEARDTFQRDVDFGAWWDKQAFKINGRLINAHERAALIDWGREPVKAMQVLTDTNRASIRLIHSQEFKPKPEPERLSSAAKTVQSEENRYGSAAKPHSDEVPEPKAPQRKRAASKKTVITEGAEQLLAQGDVLPPAKEAAKILGKHERQAAQAVDQARAMQNHAEKKVKEALEAAEEAAIDKASLPKTYQEKLDILERKLEKEFEYRVQVTADEKAKHYVEKHLIPEWKAAVEFHNNYRKNWQRMSLSAGAPLTSKEFTSLLMALHPDQSTPETRQIALDLVRRKKPKLVVPDVPKADAPAVPATLSDLDARAAAVKAERQAKRAAVKQAAE